jgi:hypothetical protein
LDDSYHRQPIGWAAWRWDKRLAPECLCALWQAHNRYWLETEGRPMLGWKCAVHGVYRVNEDGEVVPYRAPEPKQPKSYGTLKREALERHIAKQTQLFEDVA